MGLPPSHPAASSSLNVPVQKVWGFGAPGYLRSETVPSMCLNTLLVVASPLLPPRLALPRPGSGPVETRRTDKILLLAVLSQPTTPGR